ncbi:basic secretory protein-like protein [Pedobacter sp. L105]|uniref:basic secretory protein-like protein n=1 Tax=Pedobacter sp. L105 TaxID=1641871 RepID=UPI00131D5B18|nr:basic secretory protein-like protein [Pedobacter sp. L105]
MNKFALRALSAACLLFLSSSVLVSAQEKESFKKKGNTLTFITQDANFSPAVKARLIETFFKVYPELKKQFNPNAAKEVTFVIDTAYKGVAATSGTIVSFSPVWFKKHPEDVDVVTHEVMHIVQAYGENAGPWYITEGIADYVRYVYGVDNAGAKWTLPNYKEGQKYENGYRVTARFFAWMEKHGYAGIVKKIDKNMRDHTYTDDTWKTLTTKTLNELWSSYIADPTL